MKVMVKKFIFLLILSLNIFATFSQVFKNGEQWRDTDGNIINAHGGGILHHENKYYWYGTSMHFNSKASPLNGVSVYSSNDLVNWKNEGIALSVYPDGSGHKIENGCLIERPKVIYNKKTNKFVMWFHLELKGQGYDAAEYGVAESDNPLGPFKFIYAGRSCSGIWPMDMSDSQKTKLMNMKFPQKGTKEWRNGIYDGMFLYRDLGKGQMTRDMTIYVDDDEKAYHIFSSEENNTLHIVELSDDYRGHTGKYVRVLPGGGNEAPTIFKKDGKYWLIASGCTGWAPNPARMAVADNIWGPWKELKNPCVGEKAKTTFDTQGTFIFKLDGDTDKWIFMADRWTPNNLGDSRHIWLPIEFDKNGTPVLKWVDMWK